ncbi:hypothetical protein B0H19DRAFT_1271865 [Mycena capillaripes]|nr:hypothetical protein B0H19DRAFT_1271865 [Mycena capillaripes]
MAHNLFTVQELIDAMIYFLHGSVPALRACALVSQSWVHPAQSLLFCEITFAETGPDRAVETATLWARLKNVLEGSPHLVRHIRRLCIHIGLDQTRVLSGICNFPFTHLEYVEGAFFGIMRKKHALDLQQLFSLSAVRQVKLRPPGSSLEPEIFPRIFERSSPALSHLELRLNGSISSLPVNDARVGTPIALVSLRLELQGTLDHRLLPFLRPFDISHLKALYLNGIRIDSINWPELASAMTGLEVLSLLVQYTKALHLSAFPNLSNLGIAIPSGEITIQRNMMTRLMSTIAPTHHIRTIVLWLHWMMPDLCMSLDAVLSTVHVPTVEIQVDVEECDTFFPRLSAKNMLHVVPRNPQWWDDIIGSL